ncbi:Rid family hydrolase [Embleya sp. NPDC050493]|uniref:Rid family hydrolase n=1 Tax=Embleya sp. NPDC050493 TaxID=3363989 RepID=UPI0037B14384
MATDTDRGYSPVVRVGAHAWVSGVVAMDEAGRVLGGADTYAQACAAFAGVDRVLHTVAMSISDVVQTRIFLTPEADWAAAGRAFKETFADVRPAATMIRVHSLALPHLWIEVEVTAVDRREATDGRRERPDPPGNPGLPGSGQATATGSGHCAGNR